jgi:hypothetical protein
MMGWWLVIFEQSKDGCRNGAFQGENRASGRFRAATGQHDAKRVPLPIRFDRLQQGDSTKPQTLLPIRLDRLQQGDSTKPQVFLPIRLDRLQERGSTKPQALSVSPRRDSNSLQDSSGTADRATMRTGPDPFAPMSTPTPPPDPDSPEPRAATLRELLGAVLWSFFGVRKGDAMRRDAVTVRPHQVIIVGIVVAALLVLGLLTIVRIITRNTTGV